MSMLSKGLSRVFSSTKFRKHQFFSAQPSLWSSYHIWATAVNGVITKTSGVITAADKRITAANRAVTGWLGEILPRDSRII